MTQRQWGDVLAPFGVHFEQFSPFLAHILKTMAQILKTMAQILKNMAQRAFQGQGVPPFLEQFLRLWRPRCRKSVETTAPGKSTEKREAKSSNSIVFWKVGHAIRTRRRGPNTLFPFIFVDKKPPNDLKKLPKIDEHQRKIEAMGTNFHFFWSQTKT